MSIKEIARLLVSLKRDIGEDYRAAEDDEVPGMQVTIGTSDGGSWNYQTGDNSYAGSCYSHPHWSVIYLYRDSNCYDLAWHAVDELRDQIRDWEDCKKHTIETI